MNVIQLPDCPIKLREAAEKRLSEQSWPWELLSVTVHESTPYLDKSQVIYVYEVLLCRANTFYILDFTDDGTYHRLSENMFTLGTLKRILETAPAWMGLGGPVSTNPSYKPVVNLARKQ